MKLDVIYNEDCLVGMSRIPDDSVDMILCDLPYGTTACRWDSIIPFEPLWAQYKRITKRNAAIVLTASQPFSSRLTLSNHAWFKYALVWEKSRATGHVHAKNKPLKSHEDILVFSPGTTVHKIQSATRMTYNPQGIRTVNRRTYRPSRGKTASQGIATLRPSHTPHLVQEFENYPKSVLRVSSEHNVNAFHPNQKPVALFEYLIRTYSNEGETVLDNCMGSGTTAIACMSTGRHYIGFEKDKPYFDIAQKRIQSHQPRLEKVA